MNRYLIRFSYDGTRYHGWQIQPNGNSVQAELERGISLLLRHEVRVTGAGRTDAGVHARRMAAHFDVEEDLDCKQLTYRLNRVLPYDIAVLSTELVGEDLHARFSAVSRVYHYYVHTRRNPFLRHYSWLTSYQLDFNLMNEAAIGAAGRNAAYIQMEDVKKAFIKVGIGTEKKSRLIPEKERRICPVF